MIKIFKSSILVKKIFPQTICYGSSFILPKKCYCSSKEQLDKGVTVKSAPHSRILIDEVRQTAEAKGIPARPPFIDDFFVKRFNLELLRFPLTLSKQEYENFHTFLHPVEDLFLQKVDRGKIEEDRKIPIELLREIKDLGLYGMHIPVEYGGLGLSETECCKVAEVIGLDSSIFFTLFAHQFMGLGGIIYYGSPLQKESYLPRLASGSLTSAFCMSEATSGADMMMVEATATQDESGNYILNGNKTWVVNGGEADLFIVFANTKIEAGFSVFLVERSFGGITTTKAYEKRSGLLGCDIQHVSFINTPIPKENILGKIGDGVEISQKMNQAHRHIFAASCVGLAKNLLNYTIKHALSRIQFNEQLTEFMAVRKKIGCMAVDLYSMESMVYLTAGLLDRYVDQDCSSETAAAKVFCSTKSLEIISSCLDILGTFGHTNDLHFTRALRDIRLGSMYDCPVDINKLIIALSGVSLAGKEKNEQIDKLRKPFQNPIKAIKKASIFGKNFMGTDTKLTLKLYQDLHPVMHLASDCLEKNFLQFSETIEYMLIILGNEIWEPKYQMVLLRICDIAIDLYLMAAVLSRASRSKCDGIFNSDHEIQLAGNAVFKAEERIQNNTQQLTKYPFKTDDIALAYLSDKVVEQRMYACDSPYTRFVW